MKTQSIIIVILILALSFISTNEVSAKTTKVRGYVKPSSGRYVAPHYKTTPNRTKFDNFSTKGNYNPYTGKKGSASPYKYKF